MREAPPGCWCVKKCVLDAVTPCGTLAARFVNRRLALVGLIGIRPFTIPTDPTCAPE